MATSCVLKTETAQLVQPQTWTPLRFDQVLRNDQGMFRGTGMDDPESALIYPAFSDRWLFSRMVHWQDVPDGWAPVQYIEQFCRDPYGAPDTTASDDTAETGGRQFNIACWPFSGHPDVPVAVRVWHDAPEPINVTLAEFKADNWS